MDAGTTVGVTVESWVHRLNDMYCCIRIQNVLLQDILPALVACTKLSMKLILKSIPVLILQIDAYRYGGHVSER